MANPPVRITNFVPLTSIASATMDQELDQLIASLNPSEGTGIELANLSPALAAVIAGLGAAGAQPGDYCISARAAKTGWLACDGAAVSRTTYAALFTEVGTTYGVGDGSTTFNLPDLRGRVPYGKGTHTTVDAMSKNDGGAVSARGANHSHTLSAHTHTIPAHSHAVIVTGSTGDANGAVGGGTTYATTANPSATPHHHDVTLGGTTAVDGGGGVTSGPSVADTSVQLLPYQVVNYFIKT